jgi:glycosyltransferase involved in cell wall biosynthesis
MNIILIGVDYFPYIGTGDKTFWFNLTSLLAEHLERIFIISINNQKNKFQIQHSKNSDIYIYNIRPFHMGFDRTGFDITRGNQKCHRYFHKPPIKDLERSFTLLKIMPLLKKIIRENNIEVVHFMDNFGPLMSLVKQTFPHIYITISAPTYNPRFLIYDYYMKMCLYNQDKIITYTNTLKRKLINLGTQEERLKTIRWGVPVSGISCNLEQKKELKKKLNINPNLKLILWSGYLQQIRENDFLMALQVARNVIRAIDSCHFIFAFKPEYFKQKYFNFEEDRIKIITNIQDMPELFTAADLFLSPVTATKSIVAPPLTWIESMAYGVPIVTTNVGGADEIVINGYTGHIAKSQEDLENMIMKIICDDTILKNLSENARILISKEYNIERIAYEYLNLWRQKG